MTKAANRLDLRTLERADAAKLRQLWTVVKDADPPKTFTARLMRLTFAWDAQAAMAGGEAAQTRRAWNRVIRARIGTGDTKHGGGNILDSARVGTRILKDWAGTTHEVLVTEGGATWNGQCYTSLSAVARAMTGTNRNGPRFFGLREGSES